MQQPLCIWLEHFAIQCLEGTMPELRGQPVALFNGRQRIIQANAHARAGGIAPGMRCKEATARVDQLALLPLAAAQDTREVLRTLAGESLTFSPTVATWGDEEFVVDLAPARHLHTTLDDLTNRIVKTVTDAGWRWRGAVGHSLAGTRLATRLLAASGELKQLTARQEARFVRQLPMTQLTALPEFLQAQSEQRLFGYLGVHTLGDLAAVPRHAIRETLRPAEQELLDYALASPRLDRHLEPIRAQHSLEVTLPFFPPLTTYQPLLSQLESTYAHLQERLFLRRLLVARLVLVLVTEDLQERHLSMPLSRPTREPRLLLDVTRLKLADVQLTRPLVECRVELAELARETPRSRDLLAWHRQNQSTTLDELRSRLDARLNRQGALFTLATHPDPRPELGLPPGVTQAPERVVQPPLPAVAPDDVDRWQELPLLILAKGSPPQLPAADTEQRYPDYRFELFDTQTNDVVCTEYHRLRWRKRPALVRVRNRLPGEVVALDD